MAELYITGLGEPITRHVYHVPRVGDRIELRELRNDADHPEHLSGDVVGVTWCDGNNAAVRVEVLPDDAIPDRADLCQNQKHESIGPHYHDAGGVGRPVATPDRADPDA